MKTITVITLFSLGVSYANAQKITEAEVPASARATFVKQYPDIKSAKWEKEGANYEAEFDLKKVETSVLIDPSGSILETESEIKVSELPKEVSEYVTKNLLGKKIKEASKIIDTKGVITFEAEIDKVDYIFDAFGKLIKKNK